MQHYKTLLMSCLSVELNIVKVSVILNQLLIVNASVLNNSALCSTRIVIYTVIYDLIGKQSHHAPNLLLV